MNLRSLDLNLLVLLQALLEEAHVSRAARRVGLSQPAMSNALDRCRQLFEDPLLERDRGGMRLTSRGDALRKPLAAILREVGALVDLAEPALAQVRRTVHIVAADVLAAVLVRPLQDAVAAHAPDVTLSFHGWGGGEAALALVARGTVDLAVSVLPPADPRHFLSEVVREERYALAMRAGHPVAANRDADGWLDHPHIVVSAEGATRTSIDDQFAGLGFERRVGVTVPSFLLVPDLLRGSDMVALMPSLSVADERGAGLCVQSPPVPLVGFRLDMVRHRRKEHDVAIDFVAAEIRRVLKEN